MAPTKPTKSASTAAVDVPDVTQTLTKVASFPVASRENGFEPQGYCAVPLKIDVARDAKGPRQVNMIVYADNLTTTEAKAKLGALNRIFDLDFWVLEDGVKAGMFLGDDADAHDTPFTWQEGTAAFVATAEFTGTYPKTQVVIDFAYGATSDVIALVNLDKAALAAAPTEAQVGSVKKAFLGEYWQYLPSGAQAAAGKVEKGDTVKVSGPRRARFSYTLYLDVSDNDWSTADSYGPILQSSAKINPDVHRTGAGIGKDNFVYGAAVTGGRFFIDKATGKPVVKDVTDAKIYPAGTKIKPDGSPDFSDVPQPGVHESITVFSKDGSSEEFWPSDSAAGWVTTKPGWRKRQNLRIKSRSALHLTLEFDEVGVTVPGSPPTGGDATAKDADTLKLKDLNRIGGLDYDLSGVKKNAAIDRDERWLEGWYTTIADDGDGVVAAHWNGSKFVKGEAPADMYNPYDTFVSV